jgi:hypothetical protein
VKSITDGEVKSITDDEVRTMADAVNPKPVTFGKSLELSDGDLRFENGDFAVVSGADNLAQALRVSIATPAATDIFNVNYGFDFMGALGQPAGGRLVKEFIRLNLIKSLSVDDRVREVRDVIFDDDPRYFDYNPQEDPSETALRHSTTRRWRAVVVLQAVAGPDVVVKLEGAGL